MPRVRRRCGVGRLSRSTRCPERIGRFQHFKEQLLHRPARFGRALQDLLTVASEHRAVKRFVVVAALLDDQPDRILRSCHRTRPRSTSVARMRKAQPLDHKGRNQPQGDAQPQASGRPKRAPALRQMAISETRPGDAAAQHAPVNALEDRHLSGRAVLIARSGVLVSAIAARSRLQCAAKLRSRMSPRRRTFCQRRIDTTRTSRRPRMLSKKCRDPQPSDDSRRCAPPGD